MAESPQVQAEINRIATVAQILNRVDNEIRGAVKLSDDLTHTMKALQLIRPYLKDGSNEEIDAMLHQKLVLARTQMLPVLESLQTILAMGINEASDQVPGWSPESMASDMMDRLTGGPLVKITPERTKTIMQTFLRAAYELGMSTVREAESPPAVPTSTAE